MERGIYSLIHVPKTIYLPANIGILFEKKKEMGGIFLFSFEKESYFTVFCLYLQRKEGRWKMEDG
jgi:hypothetical protein